MTSSRPFGAALALVLASGGLVAAGVPAQATSVPSDCPAAVPTADVVDGLTGTGRTVERGTTPDPFSATVLGRISNGIAPGVDMIIAELDSPAITRARGVWAGMSGSPVYADDGRLIGAVSYSLAGGSPVAGLTPAEDLLELGGGTGAAGLAGSAVRAPRALVDEMVATGEVSRAQAAGGFTPLAVPVRGSVGSGRAATRALERMRENLPGTPLRAGGAVAAATLTADPAEIVPGSNYAAALSYGDVTFAGVGTTTLVCDGRAVAFGHPFFDNGPTNLSAHTASAVFVQPDDVFGAFKVANPGGVVGTVDRDARVGITGPLGVAPATTPVTASFTSPTGVVRSGATEVVLDDVTADIAAFQAITTIEKAYGAAAAGTVQFTIDVRLERADGRLQTVRRTDTVSSRSAVTSAPVSWLVADEVYLTLAPLVQQTFEDVRIRSVSITGTTSTQFRQHTLRTLDRRQANPYVPLVNGAPVRAGFPLRVRAGLLPAGSTRPVYSEIVVPAAPRSASGGAGTVEVLAGSEGFFIDETQAGTFDEVLAEVRSRPGHASITVRLRYETEDGESGVRTVTKRLTTPVRQAYREFFVTML